MTALTIRLPDSLHKKLKELSKFDGISINQFIATAAAEKIASLLTLDFLKSEAALASRKDFEKIMAKVPAVDPSAEDR